MKSHILKSKRERRFSKIRGKIKRLNVDRLSVHKSRAHVYAQVISAKDGQVLACASSLEKQVVEFRSKQQSGSSKADMAALIGKLVGERAKAKGVTKVAFDRAGYPYHGLVKSLAESAREHLQF